MEQPWDNDGIGANPSPEEAPPQSPQAALPQGPLSEVVRVLIPPLRAFAQDFYSLPFFPTEDDLNLILWHNGELGWATRNIQPSELVQFLRRPRHESRDPFMEVDNELNLDQAHVQAEDFAYHLPALDSPSRLPVSPVARSPASPLAQSPASPLAGDPAVSMDEPPSVPSNEPPVHLPAALQASQESAAGEPAAVEPAAPLPPYHTATFPPGRNLPEFIPFGRMRQASYHQGNHWPIEPELRGEIVHAELDNLKRRPQHQRLTYREILDKYTEWNPVEGVKGGVVASTLRGYNRRYTIPDKKNRVRRPQWQQQHLRALRKAVPRATNRKGNISWKTVRKSVEAATGRPFGLATLSAKWREMRGKGKVGGASTGDEDSEDGEEEEDEEGEEGVESPDDEPGMSNGRRRDGDEDEDDSSIGGATQAPDYTKQRS